MSYLCVLSELQSVYFLSEMVDLREGVTVVTSPSKSIIAARKGRFVNRIVCKGKLIPLILTNY